ncbi:MAG TPA: class I SAM-dependent methyltransferase [Acidobacteriota bacterium]|nr:class I SAM-dependent methyltransferase [Acidobacteriota bacterium]
MLPIFASGAAPALMRYRSALAILYNCYYYFSPMDFALLRRELVRFRHRVDRPAYIGQRFHSYLNGTILDVGCDQAVLKGILGPDRYTGIGLTEEASVKADLERTDHLPFRDAEWNTVICLDTLEHLNNFHAMCDELFRVAGEYVIISLPNCWVQARRSIARGAGSIWQYGLAPEAPQDRHNWFFNTEEAYNFFVSLTHKQGLDAEIVELVALENRRPLINRIWRRIKYPSRRKYLNLYPHTVVCVYHITRKRAN